MTKPEGKAPGECAYIGLKQSDTISESREGHFRKDKLRIHWEYDLTWERAMPDSYSFLFLLFWASSSNTSLNGVSRRWKTCYLMFRPNKSPSWAPTTHTGKPPPWGTDSPLCPLSQEVLRTANSRTETNTGLSHTFPQITLPSWWGIMHTAAGSPPMTTRCPSGHTAGPGPAPLRAERPPISQGVIWVSEVEAKSPGAQCRIQIGIIWGLCTFLGRGPTQEPEERVWWGRRVSDGGEPTNERVMCTYTIHPVTRVHHEIFITNH